MRTTNLEYLEVWRERADRGRLHGLVRARDGARGLADHRRPRRASQTDVFADGQVQIVEFDVPPADGRATDAYDEVVGLPLRRRRFRRTRRWRHHPRRARMLVPRGDESILPGDRIIVIGSPDAAREWSRLMARGDRRLDDVVVFGAGRDRPRDRPRPPRPAHPRPARRVECRTGRARSPRSSPRRASTTRPGSTRTSSSASESDRRDAAVFAMREDSKNLYAAMLAKVHGIGFTIGIVHEPVVGRGVRAGRDRRGGQPALGDRRGDRPLRPRSAPPPAGDARGRPLRDPRPHGAADEQARADAVQGAAR